MQFNTHADGHLPVSSVFGLGGQPGGWHPAVRTQEQGNVIWHTLGTSVEDDCASASLASPSGLRAETVFTRQTDRVWSRRDTLTNSGIAPVVLTRCVSRLCLEPGIYRLYSQKSRWCHENQGGWEFLSHGERTLRCMYGRTSQSGTPYAVISEETSKQTIAVHVEPQGNWMIRLRSPQGMGNTLCPLVIETGLCDDELAFTLLPGEELQLPTVLIQHVPGTAPENGAPLLHETLLLNRARFSGPVPLVYNTWFDDFDKLDLPRLRNQLAAARAVGCEVFVIDAGWYGVADGWACQGDWREKQDRAFRGQMAAFADEVRAAGLAFGLWMEPETVQPQAPIATEHPEWFLPGMGSTLWPDLENPDAHGWVRDEMRRLLGTYGVSWIKVDFNQPIGPDPRGKELYGYYSRWYDLLDELRLEFPDTLFENCTSGGLRLDARVLKHYHAHFISDTVHPVDTLRILQGALLRLPPGPLYSWTVLRPAGPTIPEYGKPLSDATPRALTPQGATWASCETTDIDFAVAASFPGILGFTGDMAGLSPIHHTRIRQWTEAWKQWREWMQECVAELLTPVEPIEVRDGWAAIQLRQPGDDKKHLLFVYRCHDPRSQYQLHPRQLVADMTYSVQSLPDGEMRSMTGTELAEHGITVTLGSQNQARVIAIRAADTC